MKPIVLPLLAASLLAFGALAVGCGGSSNQSGSSSPGASGAIAISNFMFSPATTSVKVGTTVVVTNKDSAEHTATADTPGGFDSGALQQGQAAHVKLSHVGTFAYHCSFHAFMRGVIKVVR